MPGAYVVVLLDEACRITMATFVMGDSKEAVEHAEELARSHRMHGYEVWRDSQRIAAVYDCNRPPGRYRA